MQKLLRAALLLISVTLPNIVQAATYGIELTRPLLPDKTDSGIKNTLKPKLTVTKKPEATTEDQSTITNYRIDNYESSYEVNPDYTYTEIIAERTNLLTARGVEYKQRATLDYETDSQSLSLLEAYVIQPNGKKIPVTSENIFTRPSQESEDAPGFSNSMTTTVVFPKLIAGSQTFVKWKLIQKKPSVVGFNEIHTPLFDEPTKKYTVKISTPANLKLRWEKRGNYVVTDKIQDNRRIITAVIENQPGHKPENSMVSVLDINPVFVVSNLDSWEKLGAIYWRQSQEQVKITPEIKELALHITGKKQGIEASQAIYNWVAQNINYVAVYLNEDAGYVPHTSTEILRNGYGDCKDHVTLMQTLLKAKGIDSYPVLINSESEFKVLPVPTAANFDHAIIYLPAYKIFADPTNKYASFGELDTSLSNKFVVIATKKGRTAYTPKTVASQNSYSLINKVKLSLNGTVDGESELNFSGNFNGDMRDYFSSDAPEQIASQLLSITPEGGTGILKVNDFNNLDIPVIVKSKWNSPYAVNIDKQIYLTTPVGIDIESAYRLRRYITFGKRFYPVTIGAKSLDWEYQITLPQGYKINHLPESKNFANAAGEYQSSYEAASGYIRVKRKLIINNDIYSPEEYPAFKELIYKPINDARSVMVLEKQ